MKIRNGFVSNSSSNSFIVAYDTSAIKITDVVRKRCSVDNETTVITIGAKNILEHIFEDSLASCDQVFGYYYWDEESNFDDMVEKYTTGAGMTNTKLKDNEQFALVYIGYCDSKMRNILRTHPNIRLISLMNYGHGCNPSDISPVEDESDYVEKEQRAYIEGYDLLKDMGGNKNYPKNWEEDMLAGLDK